MADCKAKLRFTSFDLAAVVKELEAVLPGKRVKNFYDLSPSVYLFKLFRGEAKAELLIEVGVRVHLAEVQTEKDRLPSAFAMKFRKALRGRRLESVRQVGMERVAIIEFVGEGGNKVYVILEFYAQGNLILTDSEFRITALSRSHTYDEDHKTAVGELYPFNHAAKIYLTQLRVDEATLALLLKENEEPTEQKKKNARKLTLTAFVQKAVPCLYQQLIEHLLQQDGFSGNSKASDLPLSELAGLCAKYLKFCKQFVEKSQTCFVSGSLKDNEKVVKDFSPISTKKVQSAEFIETFSSYNQGVENYYSRLKVTGQEDGFQELAWKKYAQIKEDQGKRIDKLRSQQEVLSEKARLLELNLQEVEVISAVIDEMLENKMTWDEISKDITEAKRAGDPHANLIHRLALNKNEAVLLLGDPLEEDLPLTPVELSIGLGAYGNIKQYHQRRRKDLEKQAKTVQASENVLKVAESQALKEIERKKAQLQRQKMPVRKPFWFQKFHWFISTEHYLVICGRDVHQNESLVKKHLDKHDIYVHADYGGSASVIIKNHLLREVPARTLEEAAIYAVCRSKAWDTKIISGAWWVYASQVSKSAPTGEFLPAGSFMIRGKKNFINPSRLEMSLIVLYKIDKESARRRKEEAQLEMAQAETTAEIESGASSFETVDEVDIIVAQDNTRGKKKADKKQSKANKEDKTDKGKEKQKQKQKGKKKGDLSKQEEAVVQSKRKVSMEDEEERERRAAEKRKRQRQKKIDKVKKYKEEYSEQERKLRMQIVGAKKVQQQSSSSSQEAVEEETKSALQSMVSQSRSQVKQQQKLNREQIPFFREDGGRHVRVQFEAEAEVEEAEGEDNFQGEVVLPEEPQEQTKEEVSDIYQLAIQLAEGEGCEHLVAMCAPYTTAPNASLRLKLVPGTLKKGRAARNSLGYFKRLAPEQKRALEGLDQQQLINALPSNVRLCGAGILRQEQEEKEQKKRMRKEEDRKKEKKKE